MYRREIERVQRMSCRLRPLELRWHLFPSILVPHHARIPSGHRFHSDALVSEHPSSSAILLCVFAPTAGSVTDITGNALTKRSSCHINIPPEPSSYQSFMRLASISCNISWETCSSYSWPRPLIQAFRNIHRYDLLTNSTSASWLILASCALTHQGVHHEFWYI